MVSQYFLEFYTIKSDNLWAEGRGDRSATTLSYYFDKEKKRTLKRKIEK